MIVLIKRIYDEKSKETGAILQARPDRNLNIQNRHQVENELVQYGFDELYPGGDLTVFRNAFSDTPSVTVIKNFNSLNYEIVDM